MLFYRVRRKALYDPGFCADRLHETLTQAGLEPETLVLGLSEHRDLRGTGAELLPRNRP